MFFAHRLPQGGGEFFADKFFGNEVGHDADGFERHLHSVVFDVAELILTDDFRRPEDRRNRFALDVAESLLIL